MDEHRLPPAPLPSSPDDPDARCSRKRVTEWTGYKVQLTKSCDDELSHVITNVETTAATTTDNSMMDVIHAHLAARDLLPHEQIVDAGYVTSQQQDVDLVGPTTPEPGWQAKANTGFAASYFVIDWQAPTATCPTGKTSVIWKPRTDQNGYCVVTIRCTEVDVAEPAWRETGVFHDHRWAEPSAEHPSRQMPYVCEERHTAQCVGQVTRESIVSNIG